MTECFKLSGSGNDFLALVEPEQEPSAEQMRAWCSRGLSLGADGLFILRRWGADATMTYFNADGGPAAVCINGTRCAARLAFHLGWAAERMRIVTGIGALEASRVDATRIRLGLPPPVSDPRSQRLMLGAEAWEGWAVTVGVPHFVLLWRRALESAPVGELGRRLRDHPELGADGANIDFVRFPRPDRMEIRTFERGVEAETLACGSGVLAATAAGLNLGCASLPLSALTRGGFTLDVEGRTDGGRILAWALTGDARLILQGQLLEEADRLPEPPAWD